MVPCGLTRIAQVQGYAVKLVCELPEGDEHDWHWDSTYGAEWCEPSPKEKIPQILVRTSSLIYRQPIVS